MRGATPERKEELRVQALKTVAYERGYMNGLSGIQTFSYTADHEGREAYDQGYRDGEADRQ